MKAYITKDKHGLVQLWNNKPEFNEVMDCWFAWIDKGYNNEVLHLKHLLKKSIFNYGNA